MGEWRGEREGRRGEGRVNGVGREGGEGKVPVTGQYCSFGLGRKGSREIEVIR